MNQKSSFLETILIETKISNYKKNRKAWQTAGLFRCYPKGKNVFLPNCFLMF